MTDAREALAQIIAGDEWDWSDAEIADAILAAGWTPRDESEQPGCTGAGDCPATAHTHGCYADTQGHCEHPEEHGWTPPGERVKPTVDDVARAILARRFPAYDPDECADDWKRESAEAAARAVLALFPGRTEAEVKAEALREAAAGLRAGVRGSKCNPGCHEADQITLGFRADAIEKEADRDR